MSEAAQTGNAVRTRRASASRPRNGAPLAATSIAPVLDALPLPCAVFDARDGRLQVRNDAFAREFPEVDFSATRSDFDARFEGMPHLREENEVEACDTATRRWYSLRAVAVRDFNAVLVSAANITERMEALRFHKAQQERLLFTSRFMSVGEMTTTLAHELNQPLAAIMNYVTVGMRLLDRNGPDDMPRVGEALSRARAQAEHASAVIARLREFVRAREPRRDNQSLAEIVDAVMELLKLEAEKQRVRLRVRIPPDLPDVYADRVMIEQVLLNLVKNAIEAMRGATRRDIGIDARVNLDDQIEIRVSDHGCGLKPAEAAQVFTPFFTTKSDGLGVGLAICRSIVEYHEGRLYFEDNPGGGSVFVVTLPRAAVEHAA
jgi:C4-dicarboxylate-specific signal transduction histidine kinase